MSMNHEGAARAGASQPSPITTVIPLTPSQRALVAIAHLFAIIPIWGLVADFWIWHTRREEHPEIRFQTLQALLLQAIALLITVIYAIAQIFFQLLAVLDESLSTFLCTANTWVWEGTLIVLATVALWAALSLRIRGQADYPFLGPALRRELERQDEIERQRVDP